MILRSFLASAALVAFVFGASMDGANKPAKPMFQSVDPSKATLVEARGQRILRRLRNEFG